MFETARSRILLVLVLCAGQTLLFPLYAEQPVDRGSWVLPSGSDIIDNPDQHRGQEVVVGGFVEETDPIVARFQTRTGTHRITITGGEFDPKPGDKIRVHGTLVETDPLTVDIIHAFVVPQAGLWYTWGISFIAGLWVLSRLVRHWRIDRSTLGFEPRETPLFTRHTITSVLKTLDPRDSSTDA
jgi:hypothetical protein